MPCEEALVRKKLSARWYDLAGIHAEQFRIWEALEVGALPVVLDEEQHNHLEQIGLRLPKVRASMLVHLVVYALPSMPVLRPALPVHERAHCSS